MPLLAPSVTDAPFAPVVEEAVPVEPPSRYDNLSREDKEAMMLDTIYTMARDIERLIWKVDQLERNNRILKDELEQTKDFAEKARFR